MLPDFIEITVRQGILSMFFKKFNIFCLSHSNSVIFYFQKRMKRGAIFGMNDTIKHDCFANKSRRIKDKTRLKEDGCAALCEMICLTRECPFYKTKEELAGNEFFEYDF